MRFSGLATRLWALSMMGGARLSLSRMEGIGFWKLFGTGTGEGFTPVPNSAVYAILATWPDRETALERTTHAPLFRRYRDRASESWTVYLSTRSVRGRWSGRAPFSPAPAGPGPIAALTRASLRPARLLRFWRSVPDISGRIGANGDVLFKIGMGEVPLFHQVTFSIWPDAARMDAFARSGPHQEAIRAVRAEGWFREELYARFSVVGTRGTWNGTCPLERMKEAA